jgi:hypothetical protein
LATTQFKPLSTARRHEVVSIKSGNIYFDLNSYFIKGWIHLVRRF